MARSSKPSLLFVCLGNICRSPLAEAIMRHKHSGHFSRIESCGTSNYHIGEGADRRTFASAKGRGVDLSSHESRQLTARDLQEFDIILAMDNSNLRDIESLARNHKCTARIELLIPGGAVPDPYSGGADGFERVHDIVEEACDRFIERMPL